MTTMTTQYEVEKLQRGGRGQWFGRGARRFWSYDEARAHFERFAAEQAVILGNGTRIDLRVRKGRRVLATVGGLLDHEAAKQIRELANS